MKSLHTANNTKDAGRPKTKRPRTGDGAGGGGGGNGRVIGLGIHGCYKEIPQVYVDNSGGVWESFDMVRPFILVIRLC